MNRHACTSRNRGLASVLAILMILLVGIGLSALAMQFGQQAKMDRAEILDARTRQLVIAAACNIRQRLNQELGPSTAWELSVPAEGFQQKVNISVRLEGTTLALADLDIRLDNQLRRHHLTFARDANAWRLQDTGQFR